MAVPAARGPTSPAARLPDVSMLVITACPAVLEVLRRGCCPRPHMLVRSSPAPLNWHVRVTRSRARYPQGEIVIIHVPVGILRILGIVLDRVLGVPRIPRIL
jgi:hypothetical protein